MRKAKIILSAVAIFAIAGGAFAFKATRGTDRIYYCPAVGQLPTTNTLGFRTAPIGFGVQKIAAPTYTTCINTWVTVGG